MIITLSEAKTLLNISVTTYDSYIEEIIPIIEQSICDYCNNDFIDKNYNWFSSNQISFIASSNSINYTGIGDKKLIANDTIRVYKSLRNNQTFTIDTVNSDSLVLNDIDTIIDEDENEGVHISKINYPKPLKMIASKMINYNLTDMIEDKELGVKSEKIDDYSITYEDNVNGYPLSIIRQLNNYRQVYKKDLFLER